LKVLGAKNLVSRGSEPRGAFAGEEKRVFLGHESSSFCVFCEKCHVFVCCIPVKIYCDDLIWLKGMNIINKELLMVENVL